MRSKVDIYNIALGRLGGNQFERVNTPEEEGTVATLCHTFYPHALDKALAHSEWSFARKTVVLAPKADDMPNPDYPYRYGIPTDCIRPIYLRGESKGATGRDCCQEYDYRVPFDYPYIIDGSDLLTTLSPAVLTYVRRVEDPVSWPPMFGDAVAYMLASELATAYVNDPQRQQMFLEMAERRLDEAAAIELNSQRRHRVSFPWVMARG